MEIDFLLEGKMQALCDDIILYFTTFLRIGELYKFRCLCSRFYKFQKELFQEKLWIFSHDTPVIVVINYIHKRIPYPKNIMHEYDDISLLWNSPDDIEKYRFASKENVNQILFEIACEKEDIPRIKMYSAENGVEFQFDFLKAFKKNKLEVVKCIFGLSQKRGGWRYLLGIYFNNISSYLGYDVHNCPDTMKWFNMKNIQHEL